MKRGYTVEDYREMLGRMPRDDARRRGHAATSSSASAARPRTIVPEDDATWSRECRLQEQLHLQVQRAARHQGRRAVRRRRARGGQEAPQQRPAWRCRTAISEQDNQPFIGQRVEVLVEGPSDRARSTAAKTGRPRPAHRPHALRPDRRLRRQSAPRSARSFPSRWTT